MKRRGGRKKICVNHDKDRRDAIVRGGQFLRGTRMLSKCERASSSSFSNRAIYIYIYIFFSRRFSTDLNDV